MRHGLAALAILMAAACAARADVVRIGYQKTGTLVVLKQRHGLETALAPLGTTVQWAEFQSGPTLLEAMNAGAIDLGYTGDSPPVFAQAAGVDLVYVARLSVSGRDEGILVRKDSPLRAVADLRGKRIAFTKGSSAEYEVVRVLATAGLTLHDVRAVYLSPADARAAFSAGGVDAWAIWDPFFAVAQQDPDARTLSDGTAAPSSAFLLATRAYAKAHPDRVLAVLHAVNDAAAWSGQHQDQLARIMSEVTGVDTAAEQVAAARGAYHYDLMDDAAIRLQQGVADTFAALHIIPSPVDVRAAVWTPPKGAAP